MERNTISISIPNLENFKDFLWDAEVNLESGLKKLLKLI